MSLHPEDGESMNLETLVSYYNTTRSQNLENLELNLFFSLTGYIFTKTNSHTHIYMCVCLCK
jgi:hypothetical protein